jgi:phospholipase/carboxylesterase
MDRRRRIGDFQLHVPENVRDGAPLVVLLHGRGSDEQDLRSLIPHFPSEALLVTPRAPFPAARWGYGSGWAWYRFLGRTLPEPETFESSQQQLHGFLEELPEHLPVAAGPLVLGGFSQGGTMSLAYALRHPGSVPHVLVFSGFLPWHSSVEASPATVAGTRFFWGHGTLDPNIPFDIAQEGRAELRRAGAALEARDYRIGHWIDPQELQDAAGWLAEGLDPGGLSRP